MSGESTPTARSENGEDMESGHRQQQHHQQHKPTPGFRQQFQQFSKFGDTKSDGSHITLSQADKWMKQAKVVDGKHLTTTDTGIAFKKLKQQKINFKEFETFLEQLSASKNMDVEEIKVKLVNCGAPGGRKLSQSSGNGSNVYDRLCDVSKYGASHRYRFDDTGRGRGLAGRRDLQTSSGYVQGYKNKDSHPGN